jgi:hypothetical protein
MVIYDGGFWDHVIGIVTEIKGRKWVKVRWTDGVIYEEHRSDLKVVSRSR